MKAHDETKPNKNSGGIWNMTNTKTSFIKEHVDGIWIGSEGMELDMNRK